MIERDWITAAGLRAICYVCERGGRLTHRCGYVEVPNRHALHGVRYNDVIPSIKQEDVSTQVIGKKSPILVMTAGVGGDGDGLVRRSPDLLFDVHGGLTFSDGEGYPVKSGGWWFGFDCGHYGDGEIQPDPRWPRFDDAVVRSEQYVVDECERLAAQIVQYFPLNAEAA